jgi:hypothetical protein
LECSSFTLTDLASMAKANKAERQASERLLNAPHAHPFLRQRYVEALDIDSVKEWEANPNEGDIGALHTLIDENGFYGAILVQEKTVSGEPRMRIFGGNHRHRTMKQKGAKIIPAFLYEIDDEAAMRIMLGDNVPGRLSRDNEETLSRILQALNAHTGTLRGTGHTNDDLQDLLKRLNYQAKPAPAARPNAPANPYLKAGKADAVAWPVIKIAVPPELLDRFTAVMQEATHEKPWQQLEACVTILEYHLKDSSDIS